MSSTNPSDIPDLTKALTKSLHDHWRMFLTEGIILMVLGAAAIVVPPLAGVATTIFLGWLFLIGGIVGVVSTFGARKAPGFAWSLLSAVVAVIAGGVLLWNPLDGLVTLDLRADRLLHRRRRADHRPRDHASPRAVGDAGNG